MSEIAVIDLSNGNRDALVAQLKQACRTSGCFLLTGHGISAAAVETLFAQAAAFFALPVAAKHAASPLSPFDDRGYAAFASGNVAAFMGRRGEPNDPLEKFSIGNPLQLDDAHWRPNVWPDPAIVPAFRSTLETYFSSVKQVSRRLFSLFAAALELPPNYFDHLTRTAPDSVKLNYYPALKASEGTPTRFAQHTDSVPFTLLAMDTTRDALRVRLAHTREWVSVVPLSGALFVNLGDVLQRWTNDAWVATEHYVQTTRENGVHARLSVAFFVMLDAGALIECFPSCLGEGGAGSRYSPITYENFVKEKMRRLVDPRDSSN